MLVTKTERDSRLEETIKDQLAFIVMQVQGKGLPFDVTRMEAWLHQALQGEMDPVLKLWEGLDHEIWPVITVEHKGKLLFLASEILEQLADPNGYPYDIQKLHKHLDRAVRGKFDEIDFFVYPNDHLGNGLTTPLEEEKRLKRTELIRYAVSVRHQQVQRWVRGAEAFPDCLKPYTLLALFGSHEERWKPWAPLGGKYRILPCLMSGGGALNLVERPFDEVMDSGIVPLIHRF